MGCVQSCSTPCSVNELFTTLDSSVSCGMVLKAAARMNQVQWCLIKYHITYTCVFPSGTTAQREPGPLLSLLRFLNHTQWHITASRAALDEGSARRRELLPHSTQHSQETDYHSRCEFRTRNPSKRSAADLALDRSALHLRFYWNLYLDWMFEMPMRFFISCHCAFILWRLCSSSKQVTHSA